MKSIVIELQELAARGDASLTEILRTALIVAKKLKLQDFSDWIDKELNGYGGNAIPTYRIVQGTPMIAQADSFSQSYIPTELLYRSDDARRRDSYIDLKVQISAIEHMLRDETQNYYLLDHDDLQYSAIELGKVIDRFYLAVDPLALKRILDSVRNSVLQWALKLEEQGILGEGISFSDKEKQAATNNPSIQIGAVYGQLGINQNSIDNSKNDVTVNVATVFNELRKSIKKLEDGPDKATALEKVTAIEKAADKKSAADKLGELIGFAANSATVCQAVQPYVPQLMAWIGQFFG